MIGILFVQAALAAGVAMRLDADELREGQTIGLELLVTDANPRGTPTPQSPDGLQFAFQGQSRQRQIINFQTTSSTSFRYALTALRAGDFVIPPVAVETDGGTLRTAPLTVHVEPRANGALESIAAQLGTSVAWVGQVLVYDLRFQTDKKVVNGRWSPPDAPGFAPEPSVEPATAEYSLEQDGKPLSVMELHYPIRASAPGTWTVPAGVLQAQFAVADTRKRRRPDSFIDGIGPFGNLRTEVYSAPPIEVEVRPLPTEGQPTDGTALVGHYTVAARASQTQARVGDTVTIEVEVQGDGPLAGYALPPLSGEGFRVYDDQPVAEAKLEDGRYTARATFKRAVVPQAPGRVEIPPVDLVYFDPTAGAWTHATTDAIALTVTGEASQASVASFADGGGPRGVDSLGEDILPVRTAPDLDPPAPLSLAALFLAPGAAALLVEVGRSLGRRRARSGAPEEDDLAALPSDPEARLAALERAFRRKVGARLGIGAEALRREDLAALGADAAEAERLYRALERGRYGDATQVPEAELRTFLEKLG